MRHRGGPAVYSMEQMDSSRLVTTALRVLNASAAGIPVDESDLQRLRDAAGPESTNWDADILASHVLAVALRRATGGRGAAAGE